MTAQVVASWGNVVRATHDVHRLRSRYDDFPQLPSSALPFGNGRSYGDSCLNEGGALLYTRLLDRFIRFDREQGVLACESGVLLADILKLVVPAGWFLPVIPGTAYVTVGGAIANDVHGKNHHRAGTFGRHVRQLELLRSSGERLMCSPLEQPGWFAATVGGLGLTGVITWAELQLQRIPGPWMDLETVRFRNLGEFLELSASSDRTYDYTVAWIDCLGRGAQLGRGLLQRANHADADQVGAADAPARRVGVPLTPPFSMVNGASLRVFNSLHFHWQRGALRCSREHFQTFFFPLDRILHWNRLYGPRGFYQYQCVLPQAAAATAGAQLLENIARSGLGSVLAVVKRFGNLASPGLLSFPQAGVTLALDFPNRGRQVSQLFAGLDGIVSASGGRVYPAKDGRMPGALFRAGYPRWREFVDYVDPGCSSSFWRRVMESA
jgi:FAD/FMN-containing dehydrogenase